MTVVVLLALCACPVLMLHVLAKGLPGGAEITRLRDRLTRRRGAANRQAERQRLARTLRRIGGDHDALLHGSRPARANRMKALEQAYDETLREACVAVDLEAPAELFDDVTRVQLEADLLVHGMRW